jgi:16S rRNA (adenine1518-N6/adenine1519-N6)-dimethyltransferase
VRALVGRLGIRPTKQRGQNFVTDGGTVRRIVRRAGVVPDEVVVEVGPGLGSLTLALLDAGARVVAVELDRALAAALPATVAERRPDLAGRLRVLDADALRVTGADLTGPRPTGAGPAAPDGPGEWSAPTRVVANLPYNVSVPVLLHLLEELPDLVEVLVMVQTEVAERLAAAPGSRTYGVPSVKAAWYGEVSLAGSVGRTVFWPVPNVDSSLLRLVRRPVPTSTAGRAAVFAVVDAAFAQRRKTLRSALAGWAGSAAAAEAVLRRAGVDPSLRGEVLSVADFVAVADAAADLPGSPAPDDANGRLGRSL